MNHTKILFVALLLAALFFIPVSCNTDNNNATSETTATTVKDQTTVLKNDTMYTCKMHNDVISDHPGKCVTCGMNLTKEKMTAAQLKMLKDNTYLKPKE